MPLFSVAMQLKKGTRGDNTPSNTCQLIQGESVANTGVAGHITDTNVVVVVTITATQASKVSVMKGPENTSDFHICTRTTTGTSVGVPTLTVPSLDGPTLGSNSKWGASGGTTGKKYSESGYYH